MRSWSTKVTWPPKTLSAQRENWWRSRSLCRAEDIVTERGHQPVSACLLVTPCNSVTQRLISARHNVPSAGSSAYQCYTKAAISMSQCPFCWFLCVQMLITGWYQDVSMSPLLVPLCTNVNHRLLSSCLNVPSAGSPVYQCYTQAGISMFECPFCWFLCVQCYTQAVISMFKRPFCWFPCVPVLITGWYQHVSMSPLLVPLCTNVTYRLVSACLNVSSAGSPVYQCYTHAGISMSQCLLCWFLCVPVLHTGWYQHVSMSPLLVPLCTSVTHRLVSACLNVSSAGSPVYQCYTHAGISMSQCLLCWFLCVPVLHTGWYQHVSMSPLLVPLCTSVTHTLVSACLNVSSAGSSVYQCYTQAGISMSQCPFCWLPCVPVLHTRWYQHVSMSPLLVPLCTSVTHRLVSACLNVPSAGYPVYQCYTQAGISTSQCPICWFPCVLYTGWYQHFLMSPLHVHP